MPGNPKNDIELWTLMKSGSESAYAALFRRHYASMVSYGRSLTDHQNLVPDCVQEVFIEIWTYRRTLTTPSSVKAYLLAGIRRRIAREFEREKVFSQRSNYHDELRFSMNFTVLDKMIHDEATLSQAIQLNKLMNQLPKRQKEVLHLRYHQRLTVAQISELMQINSQSVSNHLQRALRFLREAWAGDLPLFLLTNSLSYFL